MSYINYKNIQMFNLYTNFTPWIIITILLAPFFVLVIIVIGLASFGASFGLRKMYVKALLKIFEVKENV